MRSGGNLSLVSLFGMLLSGIRILVMPLKVPRHLREPAQVTLSNLISQAEDHVRRISLLIQSATP